MDKKVYLVKGSEAAKKVCRENSFILGQVGRKRAAEGNFAEGSAEGGGAGGVTGSKAGGSGGAAGGGSGGEGAATRKEVLRADLGWRGVKSSNRRAASAAGWKN